MIEKDNPYSLMQRAQYDREASAWNLNDKDHVIGNYSAHLAYDDVHDLFGDADLSEKVGLDFGCGPGRNLVRFSKFTHERDRIFHRLDGVDISPICLDKARENLTASGVGTHRIILYETNGIDLAEIPDLRYDVVMSVITLQHICVHEIRYNLMKDIFRVLRRGGFFTAQMGFGNRPGGHDYYENYYEASGTNGWHDVMVSDPEQLRKDLTDIGFTNFQSHFTDARGGDVHDKWIYFKAEKP